MDICYAKDKTKNQCESVKEAKKLFGGDMGLATSLLSRINYKRYYSPAGFSLS